MEEHLPKIEDLSEKEQQELANAIDYIMNTPPEMLAYPFVNIRRAVEEDLREANNPLIAHMLYITAKTAMMDKFLRYTEHMATFRKCEDTREGYETMADAYEEFVASFRSENDLLSQVWKEKEMPSALGGRG